VRRLTAGAGRTTGNPGRPRFGAVAAQSSGVSMKIKLIAGMIAALLGTGFTQVAHAHKGRMETCMKAALALHPGTVISLEAEIEDGKRIYEFDIKGNDGREWEVECDARTGKIIEVEEELASADDPAFKATISVDEAKEIALKKQPGEVVEMEFSIEANGASSYEFDIRDANGVEWEVEVDAITGDIIEVSREIYQIGED